MATVLVVDDHWMSREFLRTILVYAKHHVIEAGDGAEGLRLARLHRPDVVVTDLLMPVLDGFEFVRQLRAEPDFAELPVIFYTATYHSSEAQALAKACRVRDVITKPAEPQQVLRVIDAAIRGTTVQPEAPPQAVSGEFDRAHLKLITDKLAEKVAELQISNQRLETLSEVARKMVAEPDPESLLVTFCAAACEMIGATHAALAILDENLIETRLITTFDDALITDAFRVFTAEARSLRVRIGNPETSWLDPVLRSLGLSSCLGTPVASPNRIWGTLYLFGKVATEEFTVADEHLIRLIAVNLAVIYENASQRRELHRREQALRKAEEKYRGIFENAVEGIFRSAPDGKFTSVNPSLARLLGWNSPEEILNDSTNNGLQFSDPARGAELQNMLAQQGIVKGFECQVFRKDGSKTWASINMRSIVDTERRLTHYEGSVEDIATRKEVELQLLQAQKMEAIGQLAGGIAHDFNNLLTVINGYSDLAVFNLEPLAPLRRDLEEIKSAGLRAASLTRQLLTFSRKQILQTRILNLNSLITDLEKMLRRLIGENIELRTSLRPGLGSIKADPGQMEQVLMNLVVNARDAMPKGGKLTIETDEMSLDEDQAHYVGTKRGSYVTLVVSDTGTGMDAATQAHIFEPFFTTKEQGKGTGLGLSTVYGIVSQSGGNVSVTSTLRSGTTFTILLPRVTEDVKQDRQGEQRKDASRGTETILLTEDDDMVRALASAVLEQHGYSVIEARHGREAISICEFTKKPIHLLLTDIIMPEVSGRELADRAAQLCPQIKVLFMSGYSDDIVLRELISKQNTAFIQKPFATGELVEKVRQVLDSPRQPARLTGRM